MRFSKCRLYVYFLWNYCAHSGYLENRISLNSFIATGDNNRLFFFAFANRIDPDETAHNEPSHRDLRCLTFSLSALHVKFFLMDSLLKK